MGAPVHHRERHFDSEARGPSPVKRRIDGDEVVDYRSVPLWRSLLGNRTRGGVINGQVLALRRPPVTARLDPSEDLPGRAVGRWQSVDHWRTRIRCKLDEDSPTIPASRVLSGRAHSGLGEAPRSERSGPGGVWGHDRGHDGPSGSLLPRIWAPLAGEAVLGSKPGNDWLDYRGVRQRRWRMPILPTEQEQCMQITPVVIRRR